MTKKGEFRITSSGHGKLESFAMYTEGQRRKAEELFRNPPKVEGDEWLYDAVAGDVEDGPARNWLPLIIVAILVVVAFFLYILNRAGIYPLV